MLLQAPDFVELDFLAQSSVKVDMGLKLEDVSPLILD